MPDNSAKSTKTPGRVEEAIATSLSSVPWTLRLLPSESTPPALPGDAIARLTGEGIPVKVPGNVYDALLDQGLVPDPFIGTHEHDLHWIARQDWQFSAELPQLPSSSNHLLIADGLDTVAEVSIGDRTVGSTENMHRTYRFDVTEPIEDGARTVTVTFTSPYAYTDAAEAQIGRYPGAYEEPYNLIRKMAANYGWDWGPTVVSSGIWRDLWIESWEAGRLDSVRVSAGVDWASSTPGSAVGTLHVAGAAQLDSAAGEDIDLENPAQPGHYRVRIAVDGPGLDQPVVAFAPLTDNASFEGTVGVPGVRLWWPHTLGEQPLYNVEVALVPEGADEANALDRVEKRVGFRTVQMVNEPGADPELAATEGRFGLVVNGVDTFARGWNWIPNDPLVDRVTEEDYRARLGDVKDSGADWVRVWGGGIFEDDRFYDACDEMGILVWQDFPFACASYPETPEVEEQVCAEAADNIERLMSHPSLGLWNGNNENFMGQESWGWNEILNGKGWGGKYYLETLPGVLAELDPDRPYWPGSPYSGVPGQMDNSPNYGTYHSWEVWNREDYSHYLDSDPTFMAEFGWQSAPAWATLVRGIGANPGVTELDLSSPEVLNHQKAIGGMKNLERGITEHFGSRGMASTAAWHYLSQIVQARAIATGVGHWRSLWPRCQGAFIWQINDCWPVMSWAGVDVEGRRKPMWYAARRAFGDHLLYVRPREDGPVAMLVNQADRPWTAEITERLVTPEGATESTAGHRVEVAPSSVLEVPLELQIETPRTQALVIDAEGQRDVWLGVPDYEFQYESPRYSGVLSEDGTLTVVAENFIRELVLQADRIHPALQAPTQAVTLLPGERHTWHIGVRPDASPEQEAEALAALDEADWSFPILASIGDILGD